VKCDTSLLAWDRLPSILLKEQHPMMNLAHLRTQLERSFSPLACECSVTGEHSLTVKLYDPESGRVDLVISGLDLGSLRTPEAVEALIDELRYELESNSLRSSDSGLV
jgi:hypothetical protein